MKSLVEIKLWSIVVWVAILFPEVALARSGMNAVIRIDPITPSDTEVLPWVDYTRRLCMRPPLNGLAPEDEFKKVFADFLGSCEDNMDTENPKKICIPYAPKAEIARLNSELEKVYRSCPEPKPQFQPPATQACFCDCYTYHGRGINWCSGADVKSWR